MEKMPYNDVAGFYLVAAVDELPIPKAMVKSEIHVGDLEEANGAVPGPGTFPLEMD